MIDRAAEEIIGQPLHLSEESLRKALDPEIIVKSKRRSVEWHQTE